MSMKQTNGAIGNHALTFRNAAADVAVSGNTSLGEVYCNGVERLGVHVANATGGGALDAFLVQFKYHKDGDYVTVASAAADFTTPNWPVLNVAVDVVTLAAAANGLFVLDVRGVYSVKFLASANTSVSVVTIQGGGK